MIARALCPVLVGREQELSRVEDALLAALRGEGSVIALAGDAGMGKSRLCGELESRARKLGAAVLSGSCSEADLVLPYLPFLEAIGNFLETVDAAALAERLGPAARQLGNLFPGLAQEPLPAGDATEAKLRLFEAVLALLREVASESGLLLVIEDLHWADASTRELIDYVTRRGRNSRLLVIATYRRDEMHRKHPLLPTIQGWQRSRLAEIVELEPLPPDGVRRMVSTIFDDAQVGEEFRDFLHQRAEGNPFVVEEMLKAAIDRGDIFRSERGWERRPIAQLQIPETVRDTILLRVERLDEKQAEILRAAAVCGRSFDHQVVMRVAGVERAELEAALHAATQEQLIEETGEGYRFRHALTQEAIYEDLSAPKRERLHAAVAEALPAGSAAERARHLIGAHRLEEAVPAALTAADLALARHGYQEAGLLLEAVLPAVRDDVERGRLLARLAGAYQLAGDMARAIAFGEETIPVLERHGMAVEAAQEMLRVGRCYWLLGKPGRAREEYDRARLALEPAGPSPALALAYVRLAGMHLFNAQMESCRKLARRALDVAEAAGSQEMAIWARVFMALGAMEGGDRAAARRELERIVDEALAGGHLEVAGNALHNLQLFYVGDLDLAAAATLPERLRQLPLPHWRDQRSVWLEGMLAGVRGDVSGLQRAAEQLDTYQGRWVRADALIELDRADEALQLVPALDEPELELQEGFSALIARSKAAAALGDQTSLLAYLDWMLSHSGAAAEHGAGRWAALWLAPVATPDQARRLIEICEKTGTVSGLAFGAAVRGLTERDAHQLEEAISALDRAGVRLQATRCRIWLAGVLGARPEAETLLAEALATSRECGSLWAQRQAREAATRLGIDLQESESPTPDRGMSDEVGERLVTVMFADVRGYTALTGQAPPADMADRIAAYQRWAAQEVEREHGVVDKFAGDSVMATFNVSGDQVDHAAHTLRAALALRDKAALLGLPVGIGIATGPAVVGKLQRNANLSVLGETTNLAARLQAAAGAGEIVLSEESRKRLPAASQAEREELTLKGFHHPVAAYRLR